MRYSVALSALLSCVAFSCAEESNTQISADTALSGDAFVPIEREGAMTASEAIDTFSGLGVSQSAILKDDGPKNFYLAVNRNELGAKWFLSAYMRNMFPGAVFGGAASALDTKVVTFREQNGKLFLVDASGRKKTSDLFDPDILIDAFPVVTDYAPFNRLVGSDNYVLIDPANGLNEFSVLGDMFGSSFGARVDVELSYLHNLRRLDDGITYEHVFTGYTTDLDARARALWENPFRVSGTMGIGLRRYAESPEYSPTVMPAKDMYFSAPPILVPNTGEVQNRAAKWAIYEGMQPIEWLISREVLKLTSNPEYADYDLMNTIKEGIEEWNGAFGFEVLSARLAEPDEDMAQDDKNMLVVDLDPTAGFAFANWRTNPTTGEIRGASVYLSAVFLSSAHNNQSDDEEPTEPIEDDPAASRPMSGFAWGAMASKPLCDRRAEDSLPALRKLMSDNSSVSFTKKEKVERILKQVIAHEIGHTLGLRHNFKGSLVSPPSSAMDYLVAEDSIGQPGPGKYDVDALRYLYGLSDDLPGQLFCTDGDVARDTLCERFDEGSDPLVETHAVVFDLVWNFLLQFGFTIPSWQDRTTNAMLAFARSAATEDERLRAWNLTIERARVPVDAQLLADNPAYGMFADELGRFVIKRLFLDPKESRGIFSSDISKGSDVMKDAIDQAERILVNEDNIRSFETRRAMVDVLKKVQSIEALQLLKEARAEIDFKATSLSGDELLIEDDLLQRIDAALAPYFN